MKVIPPLSADMEKDKSEIWSDLSAIYYKYDNVAQKRAFREVVREISDKVIEEKWQSVYQKMYRVNNVVHPQI